MALRAPLPKEAQSDYGHPVGGFGRVLDWARAGCPAGWWKAYWDWCWRFPSAWVAPRSYGRKAGDAVEVPYQQLEQQLRREAVLNVDNSGWFNNLAYDAASLVFVAAKFVCYRVVKSNNWEVLVGLLGAAFAGVLCSDRGSESTAKYRRKHPGLIQYCWSHWQPVFKRYSISPPPKRPALLPRYSRHLCSCVRLWHQFRRNVIDRPQLMEKVIRLEKKLWCIRPFSSPQP